ncbi:MAG: hypothetical protein IPK66_05165 [Rhodospirillales bacterium]|nr:hypothetical protein [Rhodospirillales bacterium]
MSDQLDLVVIVAASGDTTPEEIRAATGALCAGLADRPEISEIRQGSEPAPDAAKSGGEVAALGALLLQIAPTALDGVLRMIRDYLSRPGAVATKVTIKRKGREVSVEFDPRRTSSADVAALVAQLDPR